jgi:beta-lactamase regulating signal transducer with metallopeptidase domain
MTLLVVSTLQVSIVLGAALAGVRLLRRRSAALRHWILSVAIACAFVGPALGWILSDRVNGSPWTTSVVDRGVLIRIDSTAQSGDGPSAYVRRAGAWLLAAREALSRPVAGARALMERSLAPLAELLLVAWAAGAIVALLLLVLRLLYLRRLSTGLESLDDPEITGLIAQLARQHAVSRRIVLLRSADPALVVTWGVRRPRVLLPEGAAQWTSDRLRVVLAHELAHIRRNDWAIQTAGCVLRAIYWFNPLTWIAAAAIRREAEHACDDLVLNSGIVGTDYATHLLAVARDATFARRYGAAAAIAQPSTLDERIRAMLNTGLDRAPLTRFARIAAAAVFSAATLTGILLSRDAAAHGGLGSFSAVLYDQSGGLLPSVKVSATHVESGQKHQATTDRRGTFALNNVPSGTYEVTMGLPGFSTVKSTVDLQPGDFLQRNIVLPLGSLEETITIVGSSTSDTGSVSPRVRPVREPPQPRTVTIGPDGIGGNIRMPRALVHVNPIFPGELSGRSAVVTVSGRIGIDGFLIDLKDISQTQPHPAFVASLLAAVRQWEYIPTLLNNAPIDTNITITGRFTSQ